MAPIKIEKQDGGLAYSAPYISGAENRLSERLSVSDTSDAVVDENGVLIPGTVLRIDDGELKRISADNQVARGIVMHPIKIADSNASAVLAAAADQDVVIMVAGVFDKRIMEHNLGRELTAHEITALAANDALIVTEPDEDPT